MAKAKTKKWQLPKEVRMPADIEAMPARKIEALKARLDARSSLFTSTYCSNGFGHLKWTDIREIAAGSAHWTEGAGLVEFCKAAIAAYADWSAVNNEMEHRNRYHGSLQRIRSKDH